MAATKTLNTRIQLKYDTFQNWTTNNPTLLAGEIAVVEVPTEQGSVSQVPAVLIKVGNGTQAFNDLAWGSALAADVYPWAKASTKPTYQASEIQGLEDFIAGEINDTNTQYQLVSLGNTSFKLQSREGTTGPWVDQDTINITYTLQTGSAPGTVSFNGNDVAVNGLKSAAYTESSAYDPAGSASDAQSAAQSYTDTQIGLAKTELIGTSSTGATANTIKGAVDESKTYTDTQIASKIGAVYKPVGSVAFANLPATPSVTELGNVYNVTDAFTADARFVEGENGKQYPAGTNVAVVEVGDDYYFDALAGTVDLSNYATNDSVDSKVSTAIQALDKPDSVVANQFVTAVSETDGIISVTRAALQATDIPTIEQSQVNGLTTALASKVDDSSLAAIAKTGNVNDLIQNSGDWIVFNCGSSSTII